jgi:hypothetical protein
MPGFFRHPGVSPSGVILAFAGMTAGCSALPSRFDDITLGAETSSA